ncbi:MAG: NYN domain-containing protein [Patescibacteria group bacterium]|nr:NYN domain-containing protein [Patescibacteria group bacterium]
MFKAKTDRVQKIFDVNSSSVKQLEGLLKGNTNVYIDYANVRPWSFKLGWNIEFRRLKQFFDSFDNMQSIKIYDGTLEGDGVSEKSSRLKKSVFKDGFKTKPVKIMKHSIDFTSIKLTATDLLEQFIRQCLIRKYDIATIEFLNLKFKDMNDGGKFYIEDRKCNFDVEIGVDMLMDFERNDVTTYVLWSGDSDFYDPVKKLLQEEKNVVLFATARKVSTELNSLKGNGLFVFDIQKIRNYICWKNQIQEEVKKIL